eukprot:323270_1
MEDHELSSSHILPILCRLCMWSISTHSPAVHGHAGHIAHQFNRLHLFFEHFTAHWSSAFLATRNTPKFVRNLSSFLDLFNYLTTMFSDPGGTEGLVDMLDDLESGTLLESRPTHRHCEKCKRPKPDRAHHCSTCRRCILKMDHHCPWVGNCVGERNYRHFILFLFFLLSGCCFVMAVTIPTLLRLYLKTYFGDLKSLDEVPFFSRYLGFLTAHVNVKHYSGASFAVMLCTSVSCALAIMGGFHMYLVLTNQTTIEMQKMKNGRVEIGADGRPTEPGSYSRGMKLNFQELFDVVDRKFWWIVWLRPEFPKPLPPHRRAQPGCIERCLCWLRCCKAREEPKHK